MKYNIIDFVPYIVITCAFLVCQFLNWKSYKKITKNILAEVKKSKTLKQHRELVDLFQRCPDCGGKLKAEMFDMKIDHMVYRCEECSSLWW